MPRASTKQKDPPLDQEARVQGAISDYRNKVFKSFAAAARHWNVGEDTVRRRHNGLTESKKDAGQQAQLLSREQELVVVDWVRFRGMVARPPDHRQIRTYAAQVSGTKPGKNWPVRFLMRHKSKIKFKKAAPLDPKRASAFTKAVAEDNVAQLQDIIQEWNIKPKNMYNMDEKPLTLGGGRKHSGKKHAFAAEQKQCYRIQSDNLKMATVIETVCADGTAPIPPGFVLPPGDGGDWEEVEGVGGLAFSPNGWTSDEIHVGWFKDDFVVNAKARLDDPNDKILLIFDGHPSHKTDEMIDWAYEHGILLYTLPPHTTHKLQPLDARVFAAVDRGWKEQVDRRTMEGQPITMATLVKDYMDVRPQAMQPSLIHDAWRVTGLWPLTLSVFGPEDYAPSASTSQTTHLPSSYPPLIPSSPVKLPDNYDYTDEESDPDYDPDAPDWESGFEDQPARHLDLDRNNNPPTDDIEDPAAGRLEAAQAIVSTEEEAGSRWEEESCEGDLEMGMEIDEAQAGLETAEHAEESDENEDNNGWHGTDDETEESEDETPTAATPTHVGNSNGPEESGSRRGDTHPPRPRFTLIETMTPISINDTPYQTRSSSATLFSPALPFNSLLPTPSRHKTPAKPSRQELERQVQQLQTQLQITEANLTAANAHCTIMAMENADVREQLSRELTKKKRKGQGPKQALGVFLNPPAKKEARRRNQEEKAAKAAAAAEQERIQEAERQARRQLRLHNAVHLTFDKPLASYRCSKKDDIQDLAAALALDQTGTIATIFARIEEHVQAHPELEQNERFKGLFGTSRRQPVSTTTTDVTAASQPAPATSSITGINPPPDISSSTSPSVPFSSTGSLATMQSRHEPFPPSASNLGLPAQSLHPESSRYPSLAFSRPAPILGSVAAPNWPSISTHSVFPLSVNAPHPSAHVSHLHYPGPSFPNYPYSLSGAGPSQWPRHP